MSVAPQIAQMDADSEEAAADFADDAARSRRWLSRDTRVELAFRVFLDSVDAGAIADGDGDSHTAVDANPHVAPKINRLKVEF